MLTRIKDIEVFLCSPKNKANNPIAQDRLICVKVVTGQEGLHGLGCATFTQRAHLVQQAILDYLKPILIGRDTSRISDIFQMCMQHAYWRNGPVLNAAVSGIDMALWDILGKQCQRPVYDLLGGTCREALTTYRTAMGDSHEAVIAAIRQHLKNGIHHIRVIHGWYGGTGTLDEPPEAYPQKESTPYFDTKRFMREQLDLLSKLRETFGFEVELILDVHERLSPTEALRFARDLEEFKLFFVEDLLAPEDLDHYKRIKEQCSTPLAAGELFAHPLEWMTLIREQSVDYLRMHISQMGGLTPARKVAAAAEQQGIMTAWHCPTDITPIGMACNVHLGFASPNFGIQEWPEVPEAIHTIFKGGSSPQGGLIHLDSAHGFGVSIDTHAAAQHPASLNPVETWSLCRRPDGTLAKP